MDSPRRSKLIRLNSDDTSYEIVCIVSQNGTAEPLIYRNDDAERSDRFDILVDGETVSFRSLWRFCANVQLIFGLIHLKSTVNDAILPHLICSNGFFFVLFMLRWYSDSVLFATKMTKIF